MGEIRESINDPGKDTAPASFFKQASAQEVERKKSSRSSRIQAQKSQLTFFKQASEQETVRRTVRVAVDSDGKVFDPKTSQQTPISFINARKSTDYVALAQLKTDTSKPITASSKASEEIEVKEYSGEVRPVQKEKGLLGAQQSLYTTQAKLEQKRTKSKGLKNVAYATAEFGVGVASSAVQITRFASRLVLDSKNLNLEMREGITQLVKEPFKSAALIRKDVESRPFGFAGEVAGDVLISKGLSKGFQKTKTLIKTRNQPIQISEQAAVRTVTTGTKTQEKYIGNLKVTQGKKTIPVKVDARAVSIQGEDITKQAALIKVTPKGKPTTKMASFSQIVSKGDEAEALTDIAVLRKSGFKSSPKQVGIIGTKSSEITDSLKQSVSIGSSNAKKFDYAGYSVSETLLEVGDDLGSSKVFNVRGKAVSSPKLGSEYSKYVYDKVKGSRPTVKVNIPSSGGTTQQVKLISSEGLLQDLSKKSAIEVARPEFARQVAQEIAPQATKVQRATVGTQLIPLKTESPKAVSLRPVKNQETISPINQTRRSQRLIFDNQRPTRKEEMIQFRRTLIDSKISPVVASRIRTSSRTGIKQASALDTRLKSDTLREQVTDVKMQPRQAQRSVAASLFSPYPIQRSRSVYASSVRAPLTPLIIPIPPVQPTMQLKFFGGRKKTKSSVPFDTEYFASVEASVFKIKGQRSSPGALAAGLDIRPIIG